MKEFLISLLARFIAYQNQLIDEVDERIVAIEKKRERDKAKVRRPEP